MSETFVERGRGMSETFFLVSWKEAVEPNVHLKRERETLRCKKTGAETIFLRKLLNCLRSKSRPLRRSVRNPVFIVLEPENCALHPIVVLSIISSGRVFFFSCDTINTKHIYKKKKTKKHILISQKKKTSRSPSLPFQFAAIIKSSFCSQEMHIIMQYKKKK